jgi:hypothetical protein
LGWDMCGSAFQRTFQIIFLPLSQRFDMSIFRVLSIDPDWVTWLFVSDRWKRAHSREHVWFIFRPARSFSFHAEHVGGSNLSLNFWSPRRIYIFP